MCSRLWPWAKALWFWPSGFIPALAIVAALAVPGTVAVAAFKPDVSRLTASAISIEAKPITEFKRGAAGETHFGRLDFRGGLQLTSPSANFGGWSGLVMDPDGRKFISISDSGAWLTGELTYDGSKPLGVTNARMGPLLSEAGLPFRRDRERDAEAIALVNGTVSSGSFLVAFEQNHKILRYDLTRDGLSPALGALPLPAGAQKMKRNNGFEAMTVMRGGPSKGAVIAISERLLDKAGNHTGWIWVGATPQKFNLVNTGEFEVTDIAGLEDGTLFVLERRFRWLEGIQMRLRRIMPDEVQPGALLRGETLLEADYEYEIDNMEGLGLSRGRPGETIITLISDNNFNNFLQRTVLLQFSLTEPQTAKARPQM